MTVDIVMSLIRAQGLLIAAMADLLEKHGVEATSEMVAAWDLTEVERAAMATQVRVI